MKVYFIAVAVLMVLNTSCNKNTAQKMSDEVPRNNVESSQDWPNCLSEYGDVGQIENQEGTIVIVMNKPMIRYNSSSRVNPCFIPEGFEEGNEVVFSGTIKESPKGVRLAGTPFKLSSITKK